MKEIICSSITPQVGTTIFYTGPALDKGIMPSVFYFALSGEESLCKDPYNQPVQFLSDFPIRIFSMTLPSHDLGLSPNESLKSWAEDMDKGLTPLEEFIEKVRFSLSYLEEQGIIEKKNTALMGLSRGGFVCAHIAAQENKIPYLLMFSPLTKLSFGKDFKEIKNIENYDAHHLASSIFDRTIRIYIGNRDQRVGTENAFSFVSALAENAFANKVRSSNIEMNITPSIGHQGHGTGPDTFKHGALWLKNHLLKQ